MRAVMRALALAAMALLALATGMPAARVGAAAAAPAAETFEFQAEVTRLMDIIINSLYSQKEVFLRELISNASDAIDKVRFMSLTDPGVLGSGEDANLEIFVSVDHERGVLKIRDRGIGMTKEDLINNLGTIAKSGTSSFVDKFVKASGGAGGQSTDLIGQFGVGFYSVYLVADSVQVVSKHNDDKQYVWESNAGGSFTIAEDAPENYEDAAEFTDLGRGTELRIRLREDVLEEYGDEAVLERLIKKYSEFINFPINLMVPSRQEVPPSPAPPPPAGEADDEDEDADEEEEEEREEGEEGFEAEPEYETVYDWQVVNSAKSVWTQPPGETSEEDYDRLYNVLARGGEVQARSYLEKTHFKAEGDIEFKAVLYIPDRANESYWTGAAEGKEEGAKLKLYVRRVFITDSFHELIPNYLAWIVGVVDSDTLPLNVSRETLQQHSSMKTIKKKLVRKVLDTIKRFNEDGSCYEEAAAEEDGSCAGGVSKYDHFWSHYGPAMKYGFLNDSPNRSRLIKLLRFRTSKSEGREVSLASYEERAKEGQRSIYYIADQNMQNILTSPVLELLNKKGYEVLYLTDPIDEWIMASGFEYNDFKFVNVNTEDLKFNEDDDEVKAKVKALKRKYKPMLAWWKRTLTGSEHAFSDVEDVRISNRLEESPATVVNSKFSYSANMDRILSSQFSQGNREMQEPRTIRKILEVNLRHPIVKKLHAMYEEEEERRRRREEEEDADKEEEGALAVTAADMAVAVYQTALVSSGYEYNKKLFTDHVFGFMRVMMGVPDAAGVDEDFDVEGFEEEGDDEEPPPMGGGMSAPGGGPVAMDAEGNVINLEDLKAFAGTPAGSDAMMPEEEEEEDGEGISEL